MLDLRDNGKEIIASFGKKMTRIVGAMQQGIIDGLRKFENERIIRAQLSGRKAANYGLYRRSGNAAGSWIIKKFNKGIDFVGVLGLDKRAWYLKIHQHHETDGNLIAKGGKSFVIPVHPSARGKSPRQFSLVMIQRKGKSLVMTRPLDKVIRCLMKNSWI